MGSPGIPFSSAVLSEWYRKYPTQTPEHPLCPHFWLTYAGFMRVTDGARTRDLL
jgi:hypothetical protein